MSHFVQIRTQLRERACLLRALEDLGHRVEEGENVVVRGDARKSETAEIVVRTETERADIGFRKAGDSYELVADWFRLEAESTLRRGTFLEEVQRRYSYNLVIDQAKEQNLIVEEETLENGEIVLLLSERG